MSTTLKYIQEAKIVSNKFDTTSEIDKINIILEEIKQSCYNKNPNKEHMIIYNLSIIQSSMDMIKNNLDKHNFKD